MKTMSDTPIPVPRIIKAENNMKFEIKLQEMEN